MAKKIKDISLQNLPACAADFIKLVVKKMRYRKKVQADVQAELAAHFEDELKDCKTGEEKEKRAEKLITEFGDAKLLAVLMRRAKKRCRPLWRTVVARTFQTIGVLILCLILYVVWFVTGKPVITTDYVAELNRIACPADDESLNAAPFYRKAVEMTKDISEGGGIFYLLGSDYDEVNDVDKQLIRQWMADNAEAFELIIAGSEKPYCWHEYKTGQGTTEMMGIHIPDISGIRKLAFALRWRVWLAVEDGRYKEAFNDLKSFYRFGMHLRGDKTLIEQLVGMAIEALAINTLCDVFSECEIDSTELAAFQKDFEQMISGEDFVVSLKAEKLFIYDEIQRCFTEDRLGGGHLYFERLKRIWPMIYMYSAPLELISRRDWTAPLHILFTHPNKQQTREMVDRLFNYCDNIACKSPAQIRNEGIDVEKEIMEMVKGNILLEMLIPSIDGVIESGHRRRISVESTLTIVAILRYKKDTGSYPDSLQELKAAGHLKELPMDPYSDKPIIYKKTGENFILYSIGRNFTDDGGQFFYDDRGRPFSLGTKEAGDWIFWPVPKREK